MVEYKIFCDESNHLEYKDNPTLRSNIMVLGGINVLSKDIERINKHIKYLKHKHNHKKELKWTKLIALQQKFYDEIIEFFFNEEALKFQALLMPDKRNLKHDIYNQGNADIFYYKMYYYIFKNLLENEINQNINTKVKIYLDYKDTRCGDRIKELLNVLHNKFKDAINFQCFTTQSHEANLIQVVDIFIGAIAYKARDDIEHKSEIKNHIVQKIESLSNAKLELGTPPWESKFNIFRIELGKGR
ncbi:MAG: DUF3800 domain-containing protein [Helicobacter sp.]|uniref:DUF3800 domain-containing protein n=1 Tax=Helicobacter sp. TaxID=218 RepID=UPI0023D02902|nr:DUF3800 domain-containing protein [Helicobacter sp.]MDE7176116.1 DUF3800 domain-containing protein [Helicobacter sp.]